MAAAGGLVRHLEQVAVVRHAPLGQRLDAGGRPLPEEEQLWAQALDADLVGIARASPDAAHSGDAREGGQAGRRREHRPAPSGPGRTVGRPSSRARMRSAMAAGG